MAEFGRAARAVRLRPYNPMWVLAFWFEKTRLRLILPRHVLGIAHVGSTSIPGMPSRPVIDISIAISDYDQAWEFVEVLKANGFHFLGENEARREVAFEKSHPYACNLFICEPGAEKWRLRLRFRDHLRADPRIRQAYAQLKRRLAREHANDLLAYQRGKLLFVSAVLSEIEP